MQVISGAAGSILGGIFNAAKINEEMDAANERAENEVEEINRLRQEEAVRQQAERADRVREADQQAARVLVAMAEMGGAGTADEDRFLGEVGAMEGIDIARIQSAYRERDAALKAEAVTIRRELNLTEKAAKLAAIGNTIDIAIGVGDAAGTLTGGSGASGNQTGAGRTFQATPTITRRRTTTGGMFGGPSGGPTRFSGRGTGGV